MAVIPAPAAPTHRLGGASFTSLATPSRGSKDTSVWQVEIQPGTPATPHRLTREEVFVILGGSALVHIDGESATAGPGDVVVVPAAVDFEIVAGGAEPLRALCCLPVGGQARLADGEPFTPPWAQ
jgi:mannose-6-phosphate isomerase-like protein (cupin superfamily)